ncbi:MAG TPA: C25 family cysteine peptidase, partial [bacterium]|nr:C25 family cysteine peptidase [bacterium]
MRLARTFAVCVLLFALTAPTTAAARWIELSSDVPYAEPEVTLLRSDMSGVTLGVDVPGIEAADVATDMGLFTELRIPGSAFSIDVGSPMLPVIREFIEIPQGAIPRLTIVSADYIEVALSDLGIEHRIHPVQASVEKLAGAREAARFVIDDDAYARAGFSPDVAASLGETGQIRAHRFVELEIFPVQYNAAAGTIRYLTSIELDVEFDGADWAATQTKLERYASPDFDAMAARRFVNADEFAAGRGVPALPIGYLVITYDAFYEEIEMLAGLRHRLGYETTVTKTSEIPGGPTYENIQSYIIDAYNTWDTPPTFVLLVGDTPQIPPFPGGAGSHVSDTYFVCMDGGGEWLPDAFIGRFSCTSEAQVTHMVDKTVKYIRFALSSGTDWTKKCTFMASSDNYTVSEGTHNYVISNWVQPAGYTDINKRYSVTYNATTAQCIADINGGLSMLTYSGHGSTNGWADGPPMTASQVQALTNVEMLPMVQSYACITGQFNNACFGETWTNAANGGVLFLGASNNSYWTEDDIMEKGVYDAWFGEDITWARGMFNEGLWDVYQAYSGGGSTQYYYEMYTVFGDPALDPWTDIPSEFTVSHQAALPLGQDVFPVDVGTALRDPVEGALVCLYMDGQFYETGLTDASGHVDIALTTPPQDVGTMEVWVSKHDFKPKSATVDVIVPVTYDINPPTIPVSMTTPLTVTVWDSAGTPLPDVEITIDGWGIAPVVDVTDGTGQASFSLTPPYGENLTVVGSELSQSYNCFEDVIPVTGAAALTSPDIDASVASIGLFGSLAPHYEGSITGMAGQTGLELYAVGCGVDASAGPSGGTTVEALVTPTSSGTIAAALARSGYNIYLEDITVQVVYGQLTGQVYDSVSSPISGAVLKGYPAGSDTTGATPVFSAVSGAFGAYDMGMDIEVGYYDVYVSKFGYL